MPKKAGKKSKGESDRPEKNSVYDFLYHDPRRIGSFLAQFDPYGYLKSATHSESVSETESEGGTIGGKLGVPTVGGIEGRGDLSASTAVAEGLSKTYDPLWANALSFLDYLQQRDLIQRDVTKARIGQFVLVSGDLEIMNLALLKNAWEDPTIKRMIEMGAEADKPLNRAERRRASKEQRPQGTPTEQDLALALLKMMPHAVQAQLSGDVDVWCNLLSEGMVVSADDLLLKHGVRIGGQWNMLGILDATPGDSDDSSQPDFDIQRGGLIGTLFAALAPVAKLMLGRPADAYGITPLLIFRETGE